MMRYQPPFTIVGTLAIKGNTLTEEQITAINAPVNSWEIPNP